MTHTCCTSTPSPRGCAPPAASRVHHRSCTTPMRRRHAARRGCHGQRPTGATCPAGLCGSKPWQQPARMQQRAFGSLTGHVAARREAPSERCRSSRRSRPPRGPSTSGLRMLPAKPTLPAATAIKLRSCSGQAHTRRPFREDCHHAWSDSCVCVCGAHVKIVGCIRRAYEHGRVSLYIMIYKYIYLMCVCVCVLCIDESAIVLIAEYLPQNCWYVPLQSLRYHLPDSTTLVRVTF